MKICKKCNFKFESGRCRQCKSTYDRRRYTINPESAKQRSKVQRVTKRNELTKHKYAYRRKHVEYYKQRSIQYYQKRKLATPSWLTPAHLQEIRNIYQECKNISNKTGISHCVDHIVPIQGDNVSGLHVPWNMQIITMVDNSTKNKKFAA